MAKFVTLEQGKAQLRVNWDEEDAFIQFILDASEAAVLNYIKEKHKRYNWTAETCPIDVKLAIVNLLSTYFDAYRDGGDYDSAIARGYLPIPVTSLLHRYRKPGMA